MIEVERMTPWGPGPLGDGYVYAVGKGRERLLLRRRPEADGPRVEAASCPTGAPQAGYLPTHDRDGWQAARMVERRRAS